MSGENWGRALLSIGFGVVAMLAVGMFGPHWPWWGAVGIGGGVTLIAIYLFRPTPVLRKPGDWGTYEEAVEWVLTFIDDPVQFQTFLRDWNEGALDEWPDYVKWLDFERRTRAA